MYTKLIEALNLVVADQLVEKKQYLTDGDQDDLPETVRSALQFANEELAVSPRPPANAFAALKEAGFLLYAGEKDSFGWLSGCISTQKGIIVFG